ncbi:NADPH-dependent 2,4-dienoyl-CoA reductase/sulfur reductase-like enzyme [Brevibacterium sanguinis]|uniref:NADPH-dependent 2,4-dienoyl-CoA reductase/sulfur reductase-like enzyme n=3 Tax=Brevibacteriaceae TaxID=85019 RepID=A0A366IQC0_9MICO|nr:NADPH-dependent 2,4-dienoyl-CoA reductase/sulfur reductase-like enzyme [Brevibacterium sanguinis]RBP74317.1 NADPH-dependent 2,4-dienoyl-CoA reductase/sulfur reductase-like enzyme [Brevibacterium celere]
MQTTRYLIIGGGMVADAAARGIRERDEDGGIVIISDDVDEPYTRPALSKKLWTDPDFTPEDNYMNTREDTGATIHLTTEATAVDAEAKTVETTAGTFAFEKLLLATGGEPKSLDLEEGDRVIVFRTFADYRRLTELSGRDLDVAVVGGGFIGTELAAALAQNSTRTTLLFPDDTLGGSVFPPDLAESFHELYEDRGVTLIGGTKVSGGRVDGETVELDCGGTTRTFDAAVLGLGLDPLTHLAEVAGIDTDDGIVVDESLRTSRPDVFAAGDVASYPDRILGRQRVEHVDNARNMGAVVGRIMAGSDETYTHTPYFYTNVFDFGYEAVGTLDSGLSTIEDWQEPQSKGTVYYLGENDRVQGVLLVNLGEGLDTAREILAEDWPHTREDLIGRLPAE